MLIKHLDMDSDLKQSGYMEASVYIFCMESDHVNSCPVR